MARRQPIVSVLGHVDHGKSTILDRIRGTNIVAREAGGITQHIGATEVPLKLIYKLCGNIASERKFQVPGLLFIDTPGHQSFTTLRARGGALADLAVLVVDTNEGMKPQTVESISILKKYRTPFVIAANKIDLIPGWRSHPRQPFAGGINDQPSSAMDVLDERLYNLVGKLSDRGFGSDRFDRVTDFKSTITIIPVSGKTGEGIPDLLLVLVGLAQRFLDDQLTSEEDKPGEGTILEIKEEKGLGTTLDVIIFDGKISKGDTVAISSNDPNYPIVTKVKALLKPKPLDEIRDPSQRFDSVKEITAAAGIKISAQNLENALAGGMIKVVGSTLDETLEEIRKESEVRIDLSNEGVVARADAIGSLEALAFEAKAAEIPIASAKIGDVSKKDLVEAATAPNPLHRVIFAFNVELTPDAQEELPDHDVEILKSDVVYRLIEEYQEWLTKKRTSMDSQKRLEIAFPGKVKIMPDCIFRVSKPAICGVRILAGRIRQGQPLMREDGREIGRIKSIRSGEESLKEARMGEEVAIAMDNVTVGRQVKAEDILYIDVPEANARELQKTDLSLDEKEVLEEIKKIKRKERPFWAM